MPSMLDVLSFNYIFLVTCIHRQAFKGKGLTQSLSTSTERHRYTVETEQNQEGTGTTELDYLVSRRCTSTHSTISIATHIRRIS